MGPVHPVPGVPADAVRKIIYTTNSIESLNYQLRKIIKNRGHFPSDDAVVKLLWLSICNIEDKRARERAKEQGLAARNAKPKAGSSKAPPSTAGSRPSARSPSPTPTGSHPTSADHTPPFLDSAIPSAAPEESTCSARSAARTNEVCDTRSHSASERIGLGVG